MQNRVEVWSDEVKGSTARRGLQQSVRSLVSKLMPVAREQVVVFCRPREEWSRDDRAAVIVRLLPRLLQSIARLAEVVREHHLSCVALSLHARDHAYPVRYFLAPDEGSWNLNSELVVSCNAVWIRTRSTLPYGALPPDTEPVPIAEILPVELMPRDRELPPTLPEARVRPHHDRLLALEKEQQVLEVLSNATFGIERTLPDDRLAIVERLWFDSGQTPFTDARHALRGVDERIETWELALEAERRDLCLAVLGLRIGDTVLAHNHGKLVRLRVNEASLHAHESGVYCALHGTRYRKDGILGKRDEVIHLHVRK